MRGVEQVPWLYDALAAVSDALGLAKWRRWVAAGATGRTLEVGCGTGRNLPLYGPGSTVFGLDPAWDSLLAARRRASNVSLVLGTAEALPFRDSAFETVVSALVFCTVPDPRRGLAEIRRVLKPGGAFRMLEHVRARAPWKARLQDLLQPAWTRVTGGCHPNRDTEAAVEAAGFRIEQEGRRAKGHMRRFWAVPVFSRSAADRLE